MAELPKIISVDDHVVEPAHLWERWLPAKFRERGPAGRAARHRRRCEHIGGGAYEQTFDDDGPQGRLLGLRGPRLHQQAPRRRGRLRPRRHDDVADHLRRDAPRLLRPEGPHRGHGDELGRGVAVASRRSRASAARRSLEAKDRELAQACVKAYNDWMVEEWCGDRGGRADPADASSRCGTPSSRPPRCGATPRAACTRCASARSRRTSGCRPSTPATGTRSSRRARRPSTVVCMHIGSSSKMPATSADAPVAVAATLSFNNAMASLADCLFSGVLVQLPRR